MHKKALIFGIESFTGSYLKDELENSEIEVFGTSCNGSKNTIKCDVREITECKNAVVSIRPDFIINLAAISFIPHIDYMDIYNVNFIGSLNILKACEEIVPRSKLLFISSAQVYKESLQPLKEDSSIKLNNHYAISKKMMEEAILLSKYNYKISRSFNYTGIKQNKNFLIPKIISHFKSNKEYITLGDIDVFRDFSDVRDVVRAYKEILFSNSKDIFFNVCSGKSISIQEILSILSKFSNHEIKIRQSKELKREKINKRISGDNSLLKSIGWNPKYKIEDTLLWMLNN